MSSSRLSQPCNYRRSNRLERGTHRMARLGNYNRTGSIASLANLLHHRYFALQCNVQLARKARTAAVSENFMAMAAFAAQVITHIFDHAEHRHLDLLKHRNSPLDIEQRDFLRRGDNHAAI